MHRSKQRRHHTTQTDTRTAAHRRWRGSTVALFSHTQIRNRRHGRRSHNATGRGHRESVTRRHDPTQPECHPLSSKPELILLNPSYRLDPIRILIQSDSINIRVKLGYLSTRLTRNSIGWMGTRSELDHPYKRLPIYFCRLVAKQPVKKNKAALVLFWGQFSPPFLFKIASGFACLSIFVLLFSVFIWWFWGCLEVSFFMQFIFWIVCIDSFWLKHRYLNAKRSYSGIFLVRVSLKRTKRKKRNSLFA